MAVMLLRDECRGLHVDEACGFVDVDGDLPGCSDEGVGDGGVLRVGAAPAESIRGFARQGHEVPQGALPGDEQSIFHDATLTRGVGQVHRFLAGEDQVSAISGARTFFLS